jgi:parallel beta helix pectate lyase-like protein
MHSDPMSTGAERCLDAYVSADGRPPSGLDDSIDDSPAIQNALCEGPGVVRIPPGFYRWSDVRVPEGVTVIGTSDATIVRACNDHHAIFDQSGVGNWSIRDLVLDGEAEEPWRQRRDLGRVGLNIRYSWGFTAIGLTVRDFSGQAVCVSRTRLDTAAYCNGGVIDRLTASGNSVGICFEERGEYVTLTNSHLMRNTTGCIIHAGNVKITQSNIGSNMDGIVIADKENGSHGVISNCLINHNEHYALDFADVTNGMTINACGIFYGGIRLRDCQGVQIAHCQVSCPVTVIGDQANAFIDNLVIEEKYKFDFSATTLVKGNFTSSGDWRINRLPRDTAYTYGRV